MSRLGRYIAPVFGGVPTVMKGLFKPSAVTNFIRVAAFIVFEARAE
jgi:hypothetical protein